MVKQHTKVRLCMFCLMSVSIGLKIASKVLNIKHFSGQLIIKVAYLFRREYTVIVAKDSYVRENSISIL